MAIFLGAKGGDILATRSVTDLMAGLKGKLDEKMAYLLSGEDEELLLGFKMRLEEELAFEEDVSDRFADCMAELERVEYADQLPSLLERFNRTATDHFARRGSVVALHELCTACYDVVMRKALELAVAGMELDSKESPAVPYCFLAGGSAGRMEQTLGDGAEYFLVHEDSRGDHSAYFEEFAYRFIAILKLCGFSNAGKRPLSGAGVWHGAGDGWRSWARNQLHHGWEGLGARLASLADLRGICGDKTMIADLTRFARNVLTEEPQAETFAPAMRKLSSLPVALGMFGGFRVVRSGEHRGEFDLEKFGLTPLVINVRILAIRHGLAETGTVGRIKALLDGGYLGVELAERLLNAYHIVTRQKIIMEIGHGAGMTEGFFLNPEDLPAEEAHHLKIGLEAVVSLQRIVYQSFAEQG